MIGMSIIEGSHSWKWQKSTNSDLTKVLFTLISFAACPGSHFCCFLHTPLAVSQNDCLRSKHCFHVQTKRGKHLLSPAHVIMWSEVFLEFPACISLSGAGSAPTASEPREVGTRNSYAISESTGPAIYMVVVYAVLSSLPNGLYAFAASGLTGLIYPFQIGR